MLSNIALSVVILSVFRICNGSPTESSCSDHGDIACANKPFHDALHDDGFSMLQEETLAEHCSDILEDIECKRNYLLTCDPPGFESFALATDGIKAVLKDLCNDTSEIRKAYRIHSSCLANSSAVYQDCILNTVDDVGNIDEYDTNGGDLVTSDTVIKKMCRFYEPFKFCVTQATRNICGDSAAQLMEQIIVRSTTPAVNEKCPKQN